MHEFIVAFLTALKSSATAINDAFNEEDLSESQVCLIDKRLDVIRLAETNSNAVLQANRLVCLFTRAFSARCGRSEAEEADECACAHT